MRGGRVHGLAVAARSVSCVPNTHTAPQLSSVRKVVERLNLPSKRAGLPTTDSKPTFKFTLDLLDQPDHHIDSATYASLLRLCGQSKALYEGKRIHQQIVKHGYKDNAFIGSLLVQMYVKCGALDEAQEWFENLSERNAYLWNFMIGVYGKHGQREEAIRLFKQMQLEGEIPDKVTFLNILSACSSPETQAQGRRIDACILNSGFYTDVVVRTAVISMYGKCGNIEDAQISFDNMRERNVISWNAMIAAYMQHENHTQALQLFDQIQHEGLLPDRVTFISAFSACAILAALNEGKKLHTRVMHTGFDSDIVVATALINMYGKCGSLDDGRLMFNLMPQRNLFTWNAMIAAYAQHGFEKEAVELFDLMKQQGVVPDKVTLVNILSLYAKRGRLDDAKNIFEKMPEQSVVSWNAMITAYMQHGQEKKAIDLFHQMQEKKLTPNNVTFASIFCACANQAALEEGKQIHALIIYCGLVSDVSVENSLVNMYGKCGCLADGWKVFTEMTERDVISWNAVTSAYVLHGHATDAWQNFYQMQCEGMLPSKVTFVGTLEACEGEAALSECKRLHTQIIHNRLHSDVVLGTALIDTYGKCGSVEDAWRTFEKTTERSTVSWNAIIGVYAQHGQGRQALQLFDQMLQAMLTPNKITFVTILSVCASLAALTTGKHIYNQILNSKLDTDVIIITALINLYSKCGSLKDARRAFDKMLERDVVSWNTMIAAYAQHGHGKEAVKLFNQMEQEGVIPDKVTFVSSLSACSHTGLVDHGRYLFDLMKVKYRISPTAEHYDCLIDILGRAGCLDEAESLIRNMPFRPSVVTWMTLLSACRKQVDVQRGERAAHQMFAMDPKYDSPYVMLSNIYTAAGREEDAEKTMKMMRDMGVRKQPGRSSIEVNGRVHEFLVDDETHPQKEEIYAEVMSLLEQMKKMGYVPETTSDLNIEKNERKFSIHSEKLAIAFGIISTPPGTPLIITKNLRVCSDCHSATKFFSKIAHREIVVRDANRFHHVNDGICSCADYW